MINKRSYFIGLGTGILFSSFSVFITYSFTYKDKPAYEQNNQEVQTEKELVEKARKMGMVFIKETQDIKDQIPEEKLVPEPAPEIQNTNIIANEEVIIYVKEGSTSYDISFILEQKGIIDNAESFNKYIIEENASKKLNFGDMVLNKGMTYKEVFDKIVLKQ